MSAPGGVMVGRGAAGVASRATMVTACPQLGAVAGGGGGESRGRVAGRGRVVGAGGVFAEAAGALFVAGLAAAAALFAAAGS